MGVIGLRENKGKYIPVLLCERCQKPIVSIQEAMLFNDKWGTSIVCHKSTCDPGWEGSLELRDILAQIISNYMGVDMKIDEEGFSKIEVRPLPSFKKFVEKLI
jgi:hypothetical protein